MLSSVSLECAGREKPRFAVQAGAPIVGKRQVKTRRPTAPTELEAAGLEPLLDLLTNRLTLNDALKKQLIARAPGEQLLLAQTMATPPRSAAEREFYGELLWANVRGRFAQTLSASDLRLWENHPADVGGSPAHVRLLKSFDDFLLAQFRYFGPALFMSYGVLRRIFEWRRDTPHRMRLLAAELELNSRAVCDEGNVHFPISQELGASKPETVKELRILFSRIRTEFSSKNRTTASIAGCAECVVKQQPRVFPSLRRALPQLKSFLLVAQEDLVLGIVTRRTHAASFFDAWVASATGYSVEHARQAMSSSRRK